MKISEIKGEQALDVLADIMEPFATIFGDDDVKEAYNNGTIASVVKVALKKHKKEVIEVMAGLNMVSPEEYKKNLNILTLPVQLMEVLNDKELSNLFTSQGQETENTSFGSATENTGVEEN